MTFKRGDRVKVTYEAEYLGSVYDGFAQVTIDGRSPIAPVGSIELLPEPQPEEPAAFGSLVEVDGEKWARLDDDEPLWRSEEGSWRSWEGLKLWGPIKVLFDASLPVTEAPAKLPDLRDSEGDLWEVDQATGLYSASDYDHCKDYTRKRVEDSYGPVVEV